MQHFELNTYVAKHEHFFKSTVYKRDNDWQTKYSNDDPAAAIIPSFCTSHQ